MSTLDATIEAISATLNGLDPGPLAELRRMTPGGPAPAAFWRLCAAHDLEKGKLDTWQRIVHVMAILADTGPPERRRPLHDRARRLGTVLCDGGDPGWGPPPGAEPRPVVSEARLARFLALQPGARGAAIERLARMISRTRAPGHGVNCIDIATMLLSPSMPKDVPLTYYGRLDHAARTRSKEGTS
ncbi:MAG: hypothetical protein BGO51_18125 [Rhodospirillales bacterium 69-11]|nr:hypothetical protein [Rhodospirillales bacterium]ODU62384.1 MAG: hypothetical protein ABS99_00750 [Acetobacteraceae bacterium SCN 69-10]OJW19297.1 MAG: hypothetical protein BGO51_18125 [Rhodospirillales bacterium 69-11]